MEASREWKTFGLDDCYSGVTFLFCFCFIISVYAPLNFYLSLPLFASFSFQTTPAKRLTQQNIKKLLPPQWNRKELAKLKKNRYLQKAEEIPQHNSDGLKHNKNNNVFFGRHAAVKKLRGKIAEIVWKFDWKQTFFREKSKTQKGKWNYFLHNLFHLLISCFSFTIVKSDKVAGKSLKVLHCKVLRLLDEICFVKSFWWWRKILKENFYEVWDAC